MRFFCALQLRADLVFYPHDRCRPIAGFQIAGGFSVIVEAFVLYRPFPRAKKRRSLPSLVESLEPRINYSASLFHAFALPNTVTSLGTNTTVPVDAFSRLNAGRLRSSNHGEFVTTGAGTGSFIEYSLNVTTPGQYTFSLTASAGVGASAELSDNGANLGGLAFPATRSWSATSTTSKQLTLDAGLHTLRLRSNRFAPFDIFGLHFTYNPPTTNLASTPTPVAAPVLPQYVAPTVVLSSGGGSNSTATDPAVAPGLALPAVTINEHAQATFNELDITGTTAGETIYVTQSGGTLTINANGQLYHNSMTLGELVVYAGPGNDSITVDSSVSIPTRLYAGTGNDTLINETTGQATIVTLDGGSNNVTGNGINTAFWVTPSDSVHASSAESAAGDVHTISGFYQPYTSTPGDSGYVTSARDGADLIDPASNGNGWTRISASLWGLGPVQQDVNQGQAADCYFLTDLQSLARLQPQRLQQMAVDLGDGTFAVQFVRNGQPVYVRVDADLPTAPWGGLYYAHPGSSGNLWGEFMEKAYAYFRSGANAYSSLDYGYMTNVYTDLGVNSTSIVLPFDQNSFYTTATARLAANDPVDVLTHGSIDSAPLVASHCYAVVSLSKDAGGTVWVTLRNPWGVDGFNDDSNPNDGFVTIDYATLYTNVTFASLVY
ncbi:MAG TPA: C2 family cysteine protease [Phycisphaerae bacterium]|nr:C2 family cysteine protease [Phycisphaerae bacterium]